MKRFPEAPIENHKPVDRTVINMEQGLNKGFRLFENLKVSESKIRKKDVTVVPRAQQGLRRQVKEAGVEAEVPLENFRNEYRTPDKNYSIDVWIPQSAEISPAKARKVLGGDYRGLTLEEGLAIARRFPSLLEKYSIDLVGARYRNECTPTVYSWKGSLKLSAICSDVSDPMCSFAYTENQF